MVMNTNGYSSDGMRSSSRWDSLKPNVRDANNKCGARQRDFCRRQLHSRTMKDERNDIVKNDNSHEVMIRFDSLRRNCQRNKYEKETTEGMVDNSDTHATNVTELALFVTKYCRHLPAEDTARSVIHDLFVPILAHSLTTKHFEPILEAIETVLRIDSHASAILAPLTTSVNLSGGEHVVVNPTRAKLFEVLHRALPKSASCLTSAICISKRINATNPRDSSVDQPSLPEMDLGRIQQYVMTALRDENQHFSSLNLLLAVLKNNPSSAQSLVTSLLWRNARTEISRSAVTCCSNCGFSFCDNDGFGTPSFLKILHHSQGTVGKVSTECATELLTALPFQLWMKGNKCQGQSGQVAPLSTFQHCVALAIEDLVRIAICKFDHNNCTSMSFVKAILKNVPFWTSASHTTCHTYETLTSTLVIKLVDSASLPLVHEVWVECLGGSESPDGKITETCGAIGSWLRTTDGRAFVVERLGRQAPDCPYQSSVKLVSAILRGCPDVVLGCRTTWHRFQGYIANISLDSHPSRAAEWVSALLRGRYFFLKDEMPGGVVTEREFVDFVAPLLLTFISGEQIEQVQCFGCEAFSFLHCSDWPILSPSVEAHMTGILDLCASSSIDSVRVHGCKALGSFCSRYLLHHEVADVSGSVLYNSILRTLLVLSSTKNSGSVQCMAFFAVGNLIQAIHRHSGSPNRVDDELLRSVAELSLAMMNAPNEKVAVNALRATGWFACLAQQGQMVVSNCSLYDFLDRAVQALSERIRAALILARQDKALSLSWKRRTGMKKQAWGACNTMALLFDNCSITKLDAHEDEIAAVYREAVRCLVECAEKLPVLHEKIAMSAVLALRALRQSSLVKLLEGVPNLGKALASCYDYLSDQTSNSRKMNLQLQTEVQVLLSDLVDRVMVHHIQEALQSDIFVSNLNGLYQWMVSNRCSSQAFSRMSQALQHSTPSFSTAIQLKFSTQASKSPGCGLLRVDPFDEL